MRRLARRVRIATLLRSFAVQGSWNYRTLIGTGFAYCLLPALRQLHGAEPQRLDGAAARHVELFNSHPYLVPMAVGAVAAMEADGESPAVIERFKVAVRGSLGTLGDRLFWAGWRPVCLLFGLILLLAGGAWWSGAAAFLLLYNAGHLAVRGWSYHLGLTEGKRVGERLKRSPIRHAQHVVDTVGAFLVGMALPLAAAAGHLHIAGIDAAALGRPWVVAAALAALAGIHFGARARTPVVLVLVGLACVGLLLRTTP